MLLFCGVIRPQQSRISSRSLGPEHPERSLSSPSRLALPRPQPDDAVRFDDDYQLEPYLAESWILSENGTTLTFRLRPDVPWHDGVPTRANDVAFTFERMVDPDTGFPNAGAFSKYTSV